MTSTQIQPRCQVISLGEVDYLEAWAIQKRIAADRSVDECPDRLLYVEHPHTYTLGSAADGSNILFSAEEIAARGISVYRADRGGDVTYHGPGQLVGYPIMKLPPGEHGLHADVFGYVRKLEQVLIHALACFGIPADVYPGLTGVWVRRWENGDWAKIAAIGVRVNTRRVTMHGFALNINTDLDYFQGIIPCGITDKPVTSMQALCGLPFDMADVMRRVSGAFAEVFERDLELATLQN